MRMKAVHSPPPAGMVTPGFLASYETWFQIGASALSGRGALSFAEVVVGQMGRISVLGSKEMALRLARQDRSMPRELTLAAGQIQELQEGVFAKRREDGALEIYASED